METWLIQPIVQYGFLGLSAVLLAVVIWLVTRLLTLMGSIGAAIAANAAAISALASEVKADRRISHETLEAVRDARDRLLQRPCIAR